MTPRLSPCVNQVVFNANMEPVLVHYYLSPYRPNPNFKPFEVENLDHFGFTKRIRDDDQIERFSTQ